MKTRSSISQNIYLVILAMLGWFALIAQLCINLDNPAEGTGEILIRYFSFFTITTNILIAICSTSLLLKPGNHFFSGQKILTALTVYILIVSIIYNVILRSLWHPTGLQRIVDEILHVVVPVMFLFYWILYVIKKKLKWTVILPWLVYPLVYLIVILLRGTASGYYPYPFMNADELGFQKVLINAAVITAGFIFVSLVLVAIGNRNRGFMHD